jgi:hypothetical protein
MRKLQIAFMMGLVSSMGAAGLAWTAEPADSAQSSGSEQLLADIQQRGAGIVVARLLADRREWDEVLAKIAAGGEDWLAVATALRPGTSAGASVSLDEAIFLAIEPAPAAVLRLLDANFFDVDLVCSANIEADHSPEQSRNFVKDRIKILHRVAARELQPVRNQCLKNLKAALRELADPLY